MVQILKDLKPFLGVKVFHSVPNSSDGLNYVKIRVKDGRYF